MRKFIRILIGVCAGFLLLCAVALMLLNSSKFQMFVLHSVEKDLSAQLGTTLSASRVHYTLFNRFSIADVYLQSLENDTLAYISDAAVDFSLRALLHKKIEIKSVMLNGVLANLKTDSAGNNFDFIVQKFSQPKTTQKSQTIELNIRQLEIKNSRLNYTNTLNALPDKTDLFSPNQLSVDEINASITFRLTGADSIAAEVKSFSAKEKSGLIISDLQTKAALGAKGIWVDFLKIRLPDSQLNFGKSALHFNSITDFQHFTENVYLQIPLGESAINLQDLRTFIPEFQHINKKVSISGTIDGTVAALRLKDLNVRYGNHTVLLANIEANGLPNIAEMFIFGNIHNFSTTAVEVQDLLANVSRQPIALPPKLGKMTYKGNISGFLSNLVIYGNLTTGIGSVSTDIFLKFSDNFQNLAYSSSIQSKKLQIGDLLGNKQLENVMFNIATKGKKLGKGGFEGEISGKIDELNFNSYTYRNLQLAGNYNASGFEGNATIADAHINADFTGKIDLKDRQKPTFDFLLNVQNADLQQLNLYTKYTNSLLTFNASTNLSGSSLDNMNGFVRLDKISFTNNDKTLIINEIELHANENNGQKSITLISDFANGKIEGNFSYNTINQTINKFLKQYLPALASEGNAQENSTENQLKINMKFSKLNGFNNAFSLPFDFDGDEGILVGELDERNNLLNLHFDVPALVFGNQKIDVTSFSINNLWKDVLTFSTNALLIDNTKQDTVTFVLNATAENNKIDTKCDWQSSSAKKNSGEISFNTTLWKKDNALVATADIEPTTFFIADSLWQIARSSLDWTADKKLNINKLQLGNRQQHIAINGTASASPDDYLKVDLNRINLESLFTLLAFKDIEFGGEPTGSVVLSSVFKKPIFIADIFVKNVTMNQMPIGDAQLYSLFNEADNSIKIDGTFFTQKSDTVVVASGNYFIRNDSLDLLFDARGIGVSFLNPYFTGTVKNFDGQAFGKLRLFGKGNALGFDGDVKVKNGRATITLLQTTYSFNDVVHLRPKSLYVNELHLFDKEGNSAIATGELQHTGMFAHPIFDFNIQAKNLIALDTKSGDNEYFYGKVYADGNIKINGNERVANFTINAVSKPKSKLFIRMQTTHTATTNNFLRFVNHSEKNDNQNVTKEQQKSASAMLTQVNMQVEVTHDTEVELITDPKSGDVIDTKGAGNLRMEFNSRSKDMRLFGTYTIQNGYYQFSLANIFHRNFKIDNGSAITWSGDMRNANVDIRGIYSLSTSLRNLLDETQQQGISSANVSVNCVLKLTDNLLSPTIKLDLELPQSDERVRQVIKNVVNTEEMMYQEFISLLLFNRFYKPEYLNTVENQNANSSNDALSFATATLNGLLSRLFQGNQFSIGANIMDSETSQKYATTINYQPNDRLVINNTMGYQTDALDDKGNRVIVDFDVEWKLVDDGKWRFKVFNHTVDRHGTSLQSQGLGFVYREDFNSVSEMMSYYLHSMTGIFRKK